MSNLGEIIMNAMVNIAQGGVLNYPLAKCHKCKTTHRNCEMFDALQIAPNGRVCHDCWTAFKGTARLKNVADLAKKKLKKQKQMELVA